MSLVFFLILHSTVYLLFFVPHLQKMNQEDLEFLPVILLILFHLLVLLYDVFFLINLDQ